MPIDYNTIKALHIICVSISVSVFCWRAWRILQGQTIPKIWQQLPHLIDSLLLASGISLLWLTDFVWLEQSWILIKLSGLPLYIIFGTLALNNSTSQHRCRYTLLALITVFSMILLARLKPY